MGGDNSARSASKAFNQQASSFISGGPGEAFTGPIYSNAGPETLQGISGMIGAANQNAGGTQAAFDANQQQIANAGQPSLYEQTMLDTAMGNNIGSNNAMLNQIIANSNDNVAANVNAQFGNSGRFGSGKHVGALTTALQNNELGFRNQALQTDLDRQQQALMGIEGTRQQGVNNLNQAIGQTGSAFANALAPSQAIVGAGQTLDADQNQQLANNYWMYQQQNPYLQQMNHLNASAGLLGSVKEQPNPFMQALGSAAQIAGAFI